VVDRKAAIPRKRQLARFVPGWRVCDRWNVGSSQRRAGDLRRTVGGIV